ncbi:MAG: hypothetical protein PHF37_11330 [Phycisphaerae bacterium]|nr:hypothetical protein [Phycisphaerae bacterium]
MSGGSYNYAYDKVLEMADSLERYSKDPLRLAFAKHLQKVAVAMHDIEWVDSGDYGEGDEVDAIKAVLGESWKGMAVEEALAQIDEIREHVAELRRD